jgi:hypothetical protein
LGLGTARAMQDGIYIEKINEPFLFELKGTPAEYKAGLERALAKGWLVLHESGTYVASPTPVQHCSPEGGSQFSPSLHISRSCDFAPAATTAAGSVRPIQKGLGKGRGPAAVVPLETHAPSATGWTLIPSPSCPRISSST